MINRKLAPPTHVTQQSGCALHWTRLALRATEKEQVLAGGQFCHCGASAWHRRGSSVSSDGSCGENERKERNKQHVLCDP